MLKLSANRRMALEYKIVRQSEYIEATGCLIWAGFKSILGYGQVRVGPNNWYAHRLSYALFKGNIPAGMCVCHTCDTPACVNPEHLWLGTRKQNSEDMVAKGRVCRTWRGGGFKKGHCFSRGNRLRKLENWQVLAIRDSTEPLRVLADRHRVSMSAISTVRRGKRKQLVK